jgi:hypothetical protein
VFKTSSLLFQYFALILHLLFESCNPIYGLLLQLRTLWADGYLCGRFTNNYEQLSRRKLNYIMKIEFLDRVIPWPTAQHEPPTAGRSYKPHARLIQASGTLRNLDCRRSYRNCARGQRRDQILTARWNPKAEPGRADGPFQLRRNPRSILCHSDFCAIFSPKLKNFGRSNSMLSKTEPAN